MFLWSLGLRVFRKKEKDNEFSKDGWNRQELYLGHLEEEAFERVRRALRVLDAMENAHALLKGQG